MEIKTKKTRKKERWVLLLAVVIGLFTLNLLSSRHFARLDLTEGHVYTLASSTKTLLKELEDVVTIQLYFTPELPPALTAIRRDVEDILEEFKTYSKNNVRVEFHNPQENPLKEQKVRMMGIPTIEVTVIKKDKQELAKIYLGMAIQHGGKQEILPIIQDTRNLEYRMAAAILKVTRGTEPVVGWWGPEVNLMKDLPFEERRVSYTSLMERLELLFEVKKITAENLDLLDPDTIPTLVFIVPDSLTEEEEKAFSKYLEKGGKAIALVERIRIGLEGGLDPEIRKNPLEQILKSYGVAVQPDLVLDRSNAMATFTGGVVNFMVNYPYWVLIRPEGFNPKEPMVSDLKSLILPWVSSVKIDEKPPEGVQVTPLFETTRFGLRNSSSPLTPLHPTSANQTIASASEGSVIPIGAMVTRENDDGSKTQLVVIGNQQFLQTGFLQQFEENGIFLENALDVLATGSSLVGIRSKGFTRKPLEMVSDLKRTMIKLMDIALSPVLLLGVGIWIFFWRRSKAKVLQILYSKPG